MSAGALRRLTVPERRRVAGLAAVIVALHVAGFALLLALGRGAFGVGVGLTAYSLGLRHAFDADHVAAIDGTTRKLMGEGQRPLSVGFFFSLGHCTVVLALGALVVLGVRGVGGAVQDDGSAVHQATGLIGPLVSGSFLLLIGVLNLAILVSVVGLLRRARRGDVAPGALDGELAPGGVLTRVYGRATRAVRRPWHMYPLGGLFGLGFDTASEVALLVLAAGAAAGGQPVGALLCLPILFAAGMVLLDTADGVFMRVAYSWALANPLRRMYYNITITGLSVAVALVIGAAQLLGVAADRLHLSGGVWDALARLDLASLGYVVVGLFVLTWAVAVAAWRLGRLEERWAVATPSRSTMPGSPPGRAPTAARPGSRCW
jgi:high-affinity nickel-transport protein